MKRWIVCAMCWAGVASMVGAPALAQNVLKGEDLNERNLVEALKLPPAAAPQAPDADAPEGGDVVTRSIRVTRDQPSSKVVDQVAKAPPAKKPSASVLITFVTNSAQLTERARASLDVVGRALQAEQLASLKFAIEGHADPRGNPLDNLRLSQARADSVVEYLVSEHQVSRDRLKPIGKGDTELMNTAHPDAPENRRVTIVTLQE